MCPSSLFLLFSSRHEENKAAKMRPFSGNEQRGKVLRVCTARTLPAHLCVETAKQTHPRQSRSTLSPPCNTCRSLSACITDWDRSGAMCSCACIIIPDHLSVQHLHVVTSNGSDVKLHYYLALFSPPFFFFLPG